MPPFAPLVSNANKRKSEGGHDEQPFKRPAGERSFWMVQYRAPQHKKHKTWDDDGVLEISGSRATLWDMTNKKITEGTVKDPQSLSSGVPLLLGGKELELDCPIAKEDFLSGRCFGKSAGIDSTTTAPPVAFSTKKHYLPPQRVEPPPGQAKRGFIPLESVNLVSHFNGDGPRSKTPPPLHAPESYWVVSWRKADQTKKNKTWEGDAFVSIVNTTATLISEKGKQLGARTWKEPVQAGQVMQISGKEILLNNEIQRNQLPSLFGKRAADEESQADAEPKQTATPTEAKKFISPGHFYGKQTRVSAEPLHNPDAPGAIVMRTPSAEHQQQHRKGDNPLVPVVIDPILARHLRPHQIEGVKFMYECVLGMKAHEGYGCILADEMGMGKTLQTVTLIWTLLKQNPYSSRGGSVGKVLVVCPVTLINNWRKEFNKWLGRDKIGIFIGDKDKAVIKQFLYSPSKVLIIGYEKLRTVITDLAQCVPPIGLIVCDEGHRLKSANNQSNKMFAALRCKRRIILSGTPIQNDLSEFHAMADFCNPGLLDDYSAFRKIYEGPILKSRAPGCSKRELEEGEARSTRLQTIAQSFVLRREASILNNYLPPKHEYTVFVTPTALQKRMFSLLVADRNVNRITTSHTSNALAMIRTLTKLSTSPMLLQRKQHEQKDESIKDALALIPGDAKLADMSVSGKLKLVEQLLSHLFRETEEKVILVSHFTSTLDVLQQFCTNRRYNYFRLDGQTPPAKRQEYVDQFNRTSQKQGFVFLLSTKAGGVGLNLIGASRLVLIDSDWNPSHDLQAMARIHRDGQRRPVFIYRLLSTGTIDEKIFQRQVTKLGLSDSLMRQGQIGASSSKVDSFSAHELRDLFTIHTATACNTHDLLQCSCGMEEDGEDAEASDKVTDADDGDESDEEPRGFVVASTLDPKKMSKAAQNRRKAELQSLADWTHVDCLDATARDTIEDDVLRTIALKSTSAEPVKEAKEADEDFDEDDEFDEPRALKRAIPTGVLSFLFTKSSS